MVPTDKEKPKAFAKWLDECSMMEKDKGFSWVIAFACCFINCLMYGVTRLSGLLLVSTVETYQVARATAAIPFSVSTSVRNLSGIFVGYLGQKVGLRIVISTGCLLASLGAGFCFFVSDVFWITIFWGGLFGIGCGFATCLLPLAINDHFDKHRGTALGLSYSGSYIGSFIFPPVVVLLIDTYGLPGAFLVISAALLNGLAASLLFGSPPSKYRENSSLENSMTVEDSTDCDKSDSPYQRDSSESYFRRLWRKLVFNVKKMRCLLQSIEFTYGQHETQVNLTSAVSLNEAGVVENNGVVSSEMFPDIPKLVPEKPNLFPVMLGMRKAKHQKENCRPVDVYVASKSTFFKKKSKTEYQNGIAKLRNVVLMRLLKKRYSYSVYAIQLPLEEVKLVYIKSGYGNFRSISFRNIHHITTNLSLNHYEVEKVASESGNYRTFDSNLTYQSRESSDILNVHNRTSGLHMNKSDSAETEKIPLDNLCNSISNSLNGSKNLMTEFSNIESYSNSSKSSGLTSTALHRNKNTRTNKRDSRIKGACCRRISRQNLNHVSYVPSGIVSTSYKLEKYKLNSISNSENSQKKAFWKIPCQISKATNKLQEYKSTSKNISPSKTVHTESNSSVPENTVQSKNRMKVFDSKENGNGKVSQIKNLLVKNTANCCFGWFRMYADPMFVVITTTMSLHTFVVVCMITIIEDFAKDLQVPDNQVHAVLMALSIADLLGALTLGMVTDRQLMSGSRFVALCFSGAGASILAISQTRTLPMLLTLVSIYGIFETGVIITLPLLISQFIEVKRQAIALAASNILSSPTVMLVPLVIGYFRDRIGCYSGVFYVLGITSFSSSLIWMLAPYLINKYRTSRQFSSNCC